MGNTKKGTREMTKEQRMAEKLIKYAESRGVSMNKHEAKRAAETYVNLKTIGFTEALRKAQNERK